MDLNNLKLIYVLNVGINTKKENIYEFIFSEDETNINKTEWGWDEKPAIDNASPPDQEFIDKICTIQTSDFKLFCLHQAKDREYMHGYHNIHAIAYEIYDDNESYDNLYDDLYDDNETPIMVFHYGMTFKTVSEILSNRDIRLK